MSHPDPVGPQLGSARKLTLVDAVAQSVGFMGPVFSIAFLVPLLVGLNASGRGAGAAAPLAVVLASVGVLGLGWIVAEYAKRIHAAGSLYDYVTDGLGGRVGAMAGLVYYVGVIALGAGLVVMLGGTIHDTLEGEFGSGVLPRTGWMLVVLALLAAVLWLGAALSTRVQLVLAVVSILAVLAFSISVIAQVGSGNDVGAALTPSGSDGVSGVLFGVLYGILLFTGFESAANLGEETAHPRRDIPRAVLFAVLVVAGFYVVGTYAQVAGYRFDLAALAKNAGAPLFGLAQPAADGGFGSVAIRRFLELVVVLDMLAVVIGVGVAGSRGLYAMGRDHRLPAALGRTTPRGVPAAALVVVLAVDAVVVLLTAFWTGLFAQHGLPHYVAVFSWASGFGAFALSIVYLLMAVGALNGLREHPRQWAVRLAVADGVLVTLAAMFGSVYQVPAPLSWAPISAVALVPVGFVLSAVFPGRAAPVTVFDGIVPAEQGPQKL